MGTRPANLNDGREERAGDATVVRGCARMCDRTRMYQRMYQRNRCPSCFCAVAATECMARMACGLLPRCSCYLHATMHARPSRQWAPWIRPATGVASRAALCMGTVAGGKDTDTVPWRMQSGGGVSQSAQAAEGRAAQGATGRACSSSRVPSCLIDTRASSSSSSYLLSMPSRLLSSSK